MKMIVLKGVEKEWVKYFEIVKKRSSFSGFVPEEE